MVCKNKKWKSEVEKKKKMQKINTIKLIKKIKISIKLIKSKENNYPHFWG